MPDLAESVSLSEAAVIAGLPQNTLLSWRHRGHVPARDYDLADLLSLTAAQRLMSLGMAVEPAAAIGWAIRDEWQHILARAGSLYLLVAPTGEQPPFEHSIVTAEQLIHRYQPTALYVNVSAVGREVLGQLSERPGHG